MVDKLNLYDLLGGLVPGTLVVTGAVILFPIELGSVGGLPSEFLFVALLAASLVAGLLIQTLGSLAEPVLFKIFGGRPSDIALDGSLGDRYLPKDASERVKNTLKKRFGKTCSDRSLFLGAMTMAEADEASRARPFNAQYAYHRSILVLVAVVAALLLVSRFIGGSAGSWSRTAYWTTFGVDLGLVLLFSWRTWQRGAYYVREVLLSAERLSMAAEEEAAGPSETKARPKKDS